MLKKLFSRPDSLPPAAVMGEKRYAFPCPESVEYQRGPLWYVVMVATVLLIAALSLLLGSITLTLAILLFAGVYFLLHGEEGQSYELGIYEHGIAFGTDFVRYESLHSYALIWQPPYAAHFWVRQKSGTSAFKSAYVFAADPEQLIRAIGDKLPREENAKEPFHETVLRLLRL